MFHSFRHSFLFIPLLLLLFSCAGNGGEENEDGKGSDKEEKEETSAKKEKNRARGPEKLLSYGIDTTEQIPEGLKIGDRAPEFRTFDADGERVVLNELLEEGPLLIFFYRGHWCPVCDKTLARYADSLGQVRDKGITPLAVTPETSSNVDSMREKSGIAVRVIPDSSHRIMKDYGVLFRVTEGYQEKIREKLGSDIASNNADEEAYLPVPATYLIDRDGKVTWRHFDPDYHERASVQEILKASKELKHP